MQVLKLWTTKNSLKAKSKMSPENWPSFNQSQHTSVISTAELRFVEQWAIFWEPFWIWILQDTKANCSYGSFSSTKYSGPKVAHHSNWPQLKIKDCKLIYLGILDESAIVKNSKWRLKVGFSERKLSLMPCLRKLSHVLF